MAKIKIEINEDFDISICSEEPGHISKKKYIDMETLYNIIDSCRSKEVKETKKRVSRERDILYSSPVLPSFNGVHVLQHIIKNKNMEIVILQRQARPTKVAFYDDIMDNVGMPSLLFAIYILDGVIQDAKVVAVKDKLIDSNTPLYRYPLTNVGRLGEVCFGSNNLRENVITNFNQLHSFPSMFFMMPCTHEVCESQNTYGLHLRPLLNYLKDKEFDNSKLIPIGMTYGEWINEYVELAKLRR